MNQKKSIYKKITLKNDSPTTSSPRKSRRRNYYSEDVKTIKKKDLVIKQSTNSGLILIEIDERSKIKTVV